MKKFCIIGIPIGLGLTSLFSLFTFTQEVNQKNSLEKPIAKRNPKCKVLKNFFPTPETGLTVPRPQPTSKPTPTPTPTPTPVSVPLSIRTVATTSKASTSTTPLGCIPRPTSISTSTMLWESQITPQDSPNEENNQTPELTTTPIVELHINHNISQILDSIKEKKIFLKYC